MTETWLDVVLVLLAFIGAAAGWRRGALRLAAALAGAAVGLVAAVLLVGLLPVDPRWRPGAMAAAALVGALLGAAIAAPVGGLLARLVAAVRLRVLDRAAGLVLGAGAAVLAGWLVVVGFAVGGQPSAQTALAGSRVSSELAARLPAAPSLVQQASHQPGVADLIDAATSLGRDLRSRT